MKRTYLLFLLIAVCLFSYGYDRTEQEMQAIAANRLSGNQAKGIGSNGMISIQKLAEGEWYHIYGSENNGFVVVSTDDQLIPVLGYSPNKYDENNLPPAFKCWLHDINEAMRNALVSGAPLYRTNVAFTPVENFVTSTWGQDDPYNHKSPVVNGRKTPTGCVATAMSQIMNYFQYPAQGEGIGSYTKSTGSSIPMAVNGIYQYDQMYDSYKKVTLTDDIREVISTLMFDAALASNMNFEQGGSGATAFDAASGFVHHFGYDSLSLKVYHKDYYSNEEWDGLIYQELMARRPVLACGVDETMGGHAFVFSGIDEDGKIYVNWGWDGSADGYYEIGALNPPSYAFNSHRSIICGLRPSKQPAEGAAYQSYWISSNTYTMTYRGIPNWLLIKSDFLANYSALTFTGTVNLCFENETGETVKAFMIREEKNFIPGLGYVGFSSGTVKVDDLPAGTYKAYLGTKAVQEDSYRKVRCPEGEIYYTITKSETGVLTVSDAQVTTGIQEVVKGDDNGAVYVYDITGRLIYTAPSGTFRVKDIPTTGLVLVKKGKTTTKYYRK